VIVAGQTLQETKWKPKPTTNNTTTKKNIKLQTKASTDGSTPET
jgi:hypothetical protein